MVGHWRSALDDAAWQLGTLSVLPAMRRPLLEAVHTHGQLSTATLANVGARFAGRVLTADEISFLVADAVDAGLLVNCDENAGAPPPPPVLREASHGAYQHRRRAPMAGTPGALSEAPPITGVCRVRAVAGTPKPRCASGAALREEVRSAQARGRALLPCDRRSGATSLLLGGSGYAIVFADLCSTPLRGLARAKVNTRRLSGTRGLEV